MSIEQLLANKEDLEEMIAYGDMVFRDREWWPDTRASYQVRLDDVQAQLDAVAAELSEC